MQKLTRFRLTMRFDKLHRAGPEPDACVPVRETARRMNMSKNEHPP
jgi:hypothetical protein